MRGAWLTWRWTPTRATLQAWRLKLVSPLHGGYAGPALGRFRQAFHLYLNGVILDKAKYMNPALTNEQVL